MPNSFDPILAALTETVAGISNAVDSTLAFIAGLREQLAAANQAALDAGATAEQLQAFSDLDSALDAKAAALAAAVANVP